MFRWVATLSQAMTLPTRMHERARGHLGVIALVPSRGWGCRDIGHGVQGSEHPQCACGQMNLELKCSFDVCRWSSVASVEGSNVPSRGGLRHVLSACSLQHNAHTLHVAVRDVRWQTSVCTRFGHLASLQLRLHVHGAEWDRA